MSDTPYNPLDVKNLGASVAEALLERDPQPLAGLPSFVGAGIYAIYYEGDFPAYAAITAANSGGQWRWPIYVGKAVPSGSRKALTGSSSGRPLLKRLAEHADSIKAASNLDISHFQCRYLVVEDIWIPLGESLLIAKFTPVWNRLVDGFGNHNPGSGRHAGMRSRWDVLHPGRSWVDDLQPRPETAEIIISEIAAQLRMTPAPPQRVKMILDAPDRLLEEESEE